MTFSAKALASLSRFSVRGFVAWSAVFVAAGSFTAPLAAEPSIARDWNEQILAAIRNDAPHPPAQARNLFSLSVCMYDAWAAYTNGPVGYVYRGKHSAANVAAARREAISYAAYRLLRERYSYSRTASNALPVLDAHMTALGYSIFNDSRDTSTAAGVGNAVYDAVSAWFLDDGCRQTNGTQAAPYPDYPVADGGYTYSNPALPVALSGAVVADINRWQRLQIVNAVDQNGFPEGPVQIFQGAQWLRVRPFFLTRSDSAKPWIDIGPPPHLNGPGDAEFRSNVVAVIRASSELTPDDGAMMDISPGAFGNNTLGANDGAGHFENPATGQPYAPNVTRRGDFARVLAEYWADGPNSETPPGHWNTIANKISDHPLLVKRVGGAGPVVDDLEWDVKTYLAVNAAVHDAACAAWSLKRYYDGWRPLSAIRYMGQLGQCTDPNAGSYHPDGLPLIPNLIELVTFDTIFSGRHPTLRFGKIAVLAWPGQPANPAATHRGVKWIHADTWVPYQRTNFVTPGFPGYVSGHSTFSRSAAEVLTALTGSPFFPGGLGTHNAPADTGLGFEKGPSETIQLQWATYFDAATRPACRASGAAFIRLWMISAAGAWVRWWARESGRSCKSISTAPSPTTRLRSRFVPWTPGAANCASVPRADSTTRSSPPRIPTRRSRTNRAAASWPGIPFSSARIFIPARPGSSAPSARRRRDSTRVS